MFGQVSKQMDGTAFNNNERKQGNKEGGKEKRGEEKAEKKTQQTLEEAEVLISRATIIIIVTSPVFNETHKAHKEDMAIKRNKIIPEEDLLDKDFGTAVLGVLGGQRGPQMGNKRQSGNRCTPRMRMSTKR